jgi:hypothetical protein
MEENENELSMHQENIVAGLKQLDWFYPDLLEEEYGIDEEVQEYLELSSPKECLDKIIEIFNSNDELKEDIENLISEVPFLLQGYIESFRLSYKFIKRECKKQKKCQKLKSSATK